MLKNVLSKCVITSSNHYYNAKFCLCVSNNLTISRAHKLRLGIYECLLTETQGRKKSDKNSRIYSYFEFITNITVIQRMGDLNIVLCLFCTKTLRYMICIALVSMLRVQSTAINYLIMVVETHKIR